MYTVKAIIRNTFYIQTRKVGDYFEVEVFTRSSKKKTLMNHL